MLAVFYPLYSTNTKAAKISEYEVESKHYLPETGTRILSVYENELKDRFQVVGKMDSKYKQAYYPVWKQITKKEHSIFLTKTAGAWKTFSGKLVGF